MKKRFFIGRWLVEPSLNRIAGPGGLTEVEPKVMQVLMMLAEQPGEVVARDQFLGRLWRDTVVTDHVLTRAVSQLREAFGDSFRSPSYIQTIPKTGYRLIAPVSAVAPGGGDGDAMAASSSGDAVAWSVSEADVELATTSVSSLSTATRMRRRALPALLVVLLLVVGTAWGTYRYAARRALPVLTPVPATTAPGPEGGPELSPDGQLLLFTKRDATGRPDLYVKRLEAEATLRLTDDPSAELFPVWMPDGGSVAFQRSEGAACGLYTVPVLGGAERRLGPCTATQYWLSVAPDGNRYAVSDRGADASSPRGIFLVDSATFQRHRLTAAAEPTEVDYEPRFSPDGRYVAFLRGLWSPGAAFVDLYVVPTDGSTAPRRLTSDRTQIAGFSWTPDGRDIVFSSNRTGNYGLWRVARSGGDVRRVAGLPAYDPGWPTIARHGNRMAYVDWLDLGINVWSFDLDAGQGAARLVSSRWDYRPALAPDGRRIAFVSNRTGAHEVWLDAGDGTDPAPLTSMENTFVGMLRWSPDGEQIAFVARPHGRAMLFVMDAEGGPPRPLATDPGDALAPAWSPDGRWIYFASNRQGNWQVWRIRREGGATVQVTRGGGFRALPSPRGDVLYFTRHGMPGLWQKRLPDGAEERLFPALDAADWGNWDVGPGGIYLIQRETSSSILIQPAQRLAVLDPATGAVRPVLDLGNRHVSHLPGIAVAPDGRRVLLSVVDRPESDVMLVDGFR